MINDILHKEKISVNQSTKQWVISVVLLINTVFFVLLYYFYNKGTIPKDNFDIDDMISVSAVVFIFSALVLAIVFFNGYAIFIDHKKIVLSYNKYSSVSLNQKDIKSFKRINKKEYFKLINTERSNNFRKKTKKKQKQRQNFLIGTPNFVIFLKNNKKIFIQTKKEASFEYAMDKMLNFKYG